MNLLRKGIVHLLSVILFIALLSFVSSTAFNNTFGSPQKLEGWVADSKLESVLVSNALTQAQSANEDSTIALDQPAVKQAATQAFSSQLVGQSVNTFIQSNYDWLKGKTSTPTFRIDLTQAKQSFATQVGQLVQTHLASLPVCTTAQLAQLQIPTDPLTVSCRPSNLDPKTEGARLTQEIATNDSFLTQPVLTATSLTANGSGQSKPYYTQLSALPKLYQAEQKLPLVSLVVAVITALCVIAIASTRRRGLRRIGFVLLEAGFVLVITKLATDTIISHIQAASYSKDFNGQIRQPYINLLHTIANNYVRTDFVFGIGFVVLAVVIFVGLIATRDRDSGHAQRQTKRSSDRRDLFAADESDDGPAGEQTPNSQASSPITPAPLPPTMDVTGPPPLKPAPRPPIDSETMPRIKKKPRPPRLVQ